MAIYNEKDASIAFFNHYRKPECGSYKGEFEVTLQDIMARPDVNEPRTWAEAWQVAMDSLRRHQDRANAAPTP